MRKVRKAPVTCLEQFLQNLGEYYSNISTLTRSQHSLDCNNTADGPEDVF